MRTRNTKHKAFTIIELLIVIIVIGLLFVVLISKIDNTTDKAKLAGVEADFRSFYTAVKTVGLESQLYLLSDAEFEEKLNDNLDIPLQFTEKVCAEKDPWNEPYIYETYRDEDTQTFYVMFASKGGRDKVEFKLENIVEASDDSMNIIMVLKQVKTLFFDTDGSDELVIEELQTSVNNIHESLNPSVNPNTNIGNGEPSIKYGIPYIFISDGSIDTVVPIGEVLLFTLYEDGSALIDVGGFPMDVPAGTIYYTTNPDGTTNMYFVGEDSIVAVISADGTRMCAYEIISGEHSGLEYNFTLQQ